MPDIRANMHLFEAAVLNGDRCRWCMFHQRAHPKDEEELKKNQAAEQAVIKDKEANATR